MHALSGFFNSLILFSVGFFLKKIGKHTLKKKTLKEHAHFYFHTLYFSP